MSNKDCEIIKEINNRLMYGESIEYIIPFDLEPFSDNVKREMLMLYIKHSTNEHGVNRCKQLLQELDNA